MPWGVDPIVLTLLLDTIEASNSKPHIIMSTSPIFTFAPVPLKSELSPLAQVAALVRQHLADYPVVAVPRHRIPPPAKKQVLSATRS